MSRTWTLSLATAAAVVTTVGCGTFVHRFQDYENPQIRGSQFDSIAVIAASDDQATMQMAARARSQLESTEDVKIVHVRGMWRTEAEALTIVCTQYQVNGLLTVEWNRLTLRDCATETVAFDVEGGLAGVDRMVDRLIDYLRS